MFITITTRNGGKLMRMYTGYCNLRPPDVACRSFWTG